VRRELDRGRLVSTMAFALRHDPAHFDLELDDEGWTSFEELIFAIRFKRYEWEYVDETIVRSVIADMDRFEIRNGRIRAVYGHSVELAKPPAIATPPAILYHGTSADNVSSILQQGVLRMRRRFAHLSSDYDWVVKFLIDKPSWTIFAIDTARAVDAGVLFRKANSHVWLTDAMPAQFLCLCTNGHGMQMPDTQLDTAKGFNNFGTRSGPRGDDARDQTNY
jgi:putative RNA 2'-phosphotransferase